MNLTTLHQPPTVKSASKNSKGPHASQNSVLMAPDADESVPSSVMKLHHDILSQIKNELVLDIKTELKDEITTEPSPFRSAKMKLQ